MTLQTTFEPLYAPYVDAGHIIHEYGVASYEALTSKTAKDIYKTIWIFAQATFYLSVLAGLYTIKLGQQFRCYYDVEWARDVNRLIHRIANYPNRCLETDEPTPQTELTAATVDVVVATSVIPEAIQTIVASDSYTMTTKLRKIASYYGIRWRNARGEGKHMRNAGLKTALQDLCPEVIAVL